MERWSDEALSVAELLEEFTRIAAERPTSNQDGPTVADLKATTYSVSSSGAHGRLDTITATFTFDLTPWLNRDDGEFTKLTLKSLRNGVLFFNTQAGGANNWHISPRPRIW